MKNDFNRNEVPEEIKKWSWAAFLLGPFWGVFNGVFSSLFSFIPVIGFVMPFVLGAKGNKWSWKNKRWESLEKFKRTQRKWLIGALIYTVVWVALITIGFVYGMNHGQLSDGLEYRSFIKQVYDSAKNGQLSDHSEAHLGGAVPVGWKKVDLSRETSRTRESLSRYDEVYESPGVDTVFAFVNKGQIVKLFSSRSAKGLNPLTIEKVKKVLGKPEQEGEENGHYFLIYKAGKHNVVFDIKTHGVSVTIWNGDNG